MARRKKQSRRISVFKGREAKLNKAIFHILAHKEPQTIYDIHKRVKKRREFKHLRYASVNKRVRSLEKEGYIKRTGIKKTLAGFEATLYELTANAYLAIQLNSVNIDKLLTQVDEATAQTILASITYSM